MLSKVLLEEALKAEEGMRRFRLEDVREEVKAVTGSRFVTEPVPKYEIPEKELTPRAAYELFHSEINITNIRALSDQEVRIGARFRSTDDVQQRGLERFIRRLERALLKKRTD